LQNVHLREVSRYKIAELIEKSVPATQKLIAEAVMTDLNTWLYRIREASQYLGEVAFYHTEMRRTRMKERMEKDPYLAKFKLNSPLELIADEMDEFDILNNEETETQVDFSPLFECLHIHETLGQAATFRAEYAATRRTQKDLIMPTALNLVDEDGSDLSTLLESIAGFAIVERATIEKTENFRAQTDVRGFTEHAMVMCNANERRLTSYGIPCARTLLASSTRAFLPLMTTSFFYESKVASVSSYKQWRYVGVCKRCRLQS